MVVPGSRVDAGSLSAAQSPEAPACSSASCYSASDVSGSRPAATGLSVHSTVSM